MPTPLIITAILTGILMIVAFLNGLLTRNYSTVDRLWSVLPPLYSLIWLPMFISNPRYIIAMALVIAWGFRLTRNFAIKGGYRMKAGRFVEEDYRWAILRKRIPNRAAFELFNFFFISLFQLTLIFSFSLPLYIAGTSAKPLGAADIVLFALFAFFLAIETLADEQQLKYYDMRGNVDEETQDARIALGFNTYGLWRFVRHPNYVCEMSMWIIVGFYPVAAGLSWYPYGLASLVLVMLFIGSTIMAEGITKEKYPRYSDWARATPSWLVFTLPFRLNARRKFWESLES